MRAGACSTAWRSKCAAPACARPAAADCKKFNAPTKAFTPARGGGATIDGLFFVEPVVTDLSKITCIEDLRVIAERRVPRMFYDYADSGSWTEGTYRANESDFQPIKLRQRVAVNMEGRTTATAMVGQQASMPVSIAPVGLTGMQHADGEIHAARAAEKFGIPFTLSTMSICSIEDIAENTTAPFWFQLYMMRDRDAMARMIQRAKDAKCSALVLTLDLQVIGQRHKDIKNGLTAPPRPTLANIVNLMTKPQWCLGMAGTKRRTFRNLVGHVKGVSDMSSLAAWTNEQFDPRLSWADVAWVKEQWGGKLILKGIMEAEDAVLASRHGADAIVVSNHGGRQLDGAPSSIHALPAIVDAVGNRLEVWMDGGIRSGQDVLKAWALGARGTMIGRAMVYGLGAFGEAGVTKALQIIHKELDVSMAFCGHTNIQNVDRSILVPGTYPTA
jgi:L-lactate dehydrogenase (cytochrome)/glycolate oxidase